VPLPEDEIQRQLAVVAKQLWALGRALGRLAWLLLARAGRALARARVLGLRETARRAGVLLISGASFFVASLMVFALVTALVGASVASPIARTLVGLVAVAALPLVARRFWSWPGLFTVCQALVILVLVLAGGRSLGAALRRHGDWFLPRRESGAPAWLRARILATGALLEGFHAPPQMLSHELPPVPLFGPWRSDESPEVADAEWARWFHPLVDRALPSFETRRFGAARPSPRPPECELGHCGVDLAEPAGTPVFAAADGLVEHVERDAAAGGRSGRYVRLAHLDGAVVTRYLHLDAIRGDLRVGARIRAGERLGTVGRSGVDENFPHLHFALSQRNGSSERYLDPEPFLRAWDSVSPSDSR
jgi:peptidase M23-like protein